MAEDWAANVKKYVPDADDGIIAGIVRYCGIALQKRDSSLVSFGDPAETARVRENFLRKKLALTDSDADLDAAIASVGQRMKGENFRNRVTVYYLLAEHFGVLSLFDKSGTGKAAVSESAATRDAPPSTATSSAAGLGAAGLGAAGAAGAASLFGAGETPAAEPAAPDPVTPHASDRPAAATTGSTAGATASQRLTSSYDGEEPKSSMRWLWWLLLALILVGLLWWLFHRSHQAAPAAAPAATEATQTDLTAPPADGTTDLSAAPAEGSVAIPSGAGVTTEMRDGKPVVKVYFDTGKTDVASAFGATAGGLKAWLGSHAGSSLGVSGFNDKTGNAAANAALSKERAQAVKAALVGAGIADASVELVKPADTTDTTTDNAAARRVEVVVR